MCVIRALFNTETILDFNIMKLSWSQNADVGQAGVSNPTTMTFFGQTEQLN